MTKYNVQIFAISYKTDEEMHERATSCLGLQLSMHISMQHFIHNSCRTLTDFGDVLN